MEFEQNFNQSKSFVAFECRACCFVVLECRVLLFFIFDVHSVWTVHSQKMFRVEKEKIPIVKELLSKEDIQFEFIQNLHNSNGSTDDTEEDQEDESTSEFNVEDVSTS